MIRNKKKILIVVILFCAICLIVYNFAIKQRENNKDITYGNITEHEMTAQNVSDETSNDGLESFSFFDVEPGQYMLSNVTYEINKIDGDSSSFAYSVYWEPMGNDIRIGLISEDKGDMYFVDCTGGRDKGLIDTTQVPAGNYYVMICNEESSGMNLDGTIAYDFYSTTTIID